MKKNRILASLTAALLAFALFGITACDNGNKDDDDDGGPAPGTITTLNGRTFVCGEYTYTLEYAESFYTSGGGTASGQVKKQAEKRTNYVYITGTSDTEATYYSWHPYTSAYSSSSMTYSINGNTITFNQFGSEWTATITGGDSFTVAAESYGTGMTISTSEQVFTEGTAPSSGSSEQTVNETY